MQAEHSCPSKFCCKQTTTMPTHLMRKEMMEMHPPACLEGWLSAHTPASMNTVIHLPHVYEHKHHHSFTKCFEHKQHHSFTTCLWTQTASFIYHMSMNTTSILHLPHVHEHNQCHSFTTCFLKQLQHLNFSLHTDMACNSFITVFIRFCGRSESLLVNFYVLAKCSNSCITKPLFHSCMALRLSLLHLKHSGLFIPLFKQTKPWQNSEQQNWQYSTIWQEAWKYRYI